MRGLLLQATTLALAATGVALVVAFWQGYNLAYAIAFALLAVGSGLVMTAGSAPPGAARIGFGPDQYLRQVHPGEPVGQRHWRAEAATRLVVGIGMTAVGAIVSLVTLWV
jgi:hypothetical protein